MGSKKHLVDLDVDGTVESTGFIKTSGTSSQFLKADGSVDSSTYLTTETDSQSLSISGHTISLTNGGSVTVPDNDTTYTSSDFNHDSLTGFVSNEHLDWTTDRGATNIHANNYTNTNTFRAIHDAPVNGATTTSISSNWAFDNVKTAVPTGAVFTDTNTNTQLSSGDITAMGFSTTDNDTTYVSSDFTHNSLSGVSANEHLDWTTDRGATNIHANNYTNTNTFRAIHDTPADGATTTSISSNWAFDNVKTAVPSGALFTDTNTQNTYSSSDFTHNSLSGVSANEHLDWTADQGASNIHANNYTNTNTFRAISSTPTDGATTTSISSDWAFDNVKTAVPSGAVFTDNNTQRAIHDTPVNGATTTSISSNWAFDNVKTAVPTGALFTDTNDNTQLTSGQITSDFTHDSLSGVDANEHLDWTADQGATNIHANNYTNTNTQLSSADITAMGFSTTDNDTTYSSSDFTHDDLTGFVANEHIDWTADQGATNIHSGNYIDTNTQLSDGDIAAMGYVKTDNDTQLSEAEITAMGFTQSAGTVGGNGAVNRLPKFSTGGTNVENSSITDNGTSVFFGDGSLTLNDASFNMIKASANMQIVGSSDAVHNLELGSSTVDFNTITLRASSSLVYKADNVEKLSIDGNGHLDTVGNVTGANLSGTNTGDNAINSLYSGLVSDVNHNVTTNLTTTHNASTVVVNSSDGTNATINAATATTAGIMSEAIYDQHLLNNAKVTNSNTAWNALTGNQDDIALSEFDDDLGVLTSLSGAVLTTGTQSVAGDKTFTGAVKFNTFGNLDTASDLGMQFELGTAALNTMRTDADAFRIYFGGTGSNGEALKITQNGLMTLKTSGTTEFQWDLDGDFHADGDVIAYSTTVSDRNLKENITTIENATETVKKLRGVQYEWKEGSGKREGQTEIGVIAQEIEEVLPFLVREKTVKEKKVKTVDYEKLVGLLIESNKELSDRLDKLEGCSCKKQ